MFSLTLQKWHTDPDVSQTTDENVYNQKSEVLRLEASDELNNLPSTIKFSLLSQTPQLQALK